MKDHIPEKVPTKGSKIVYKSGIERLDRSILLSEVGAPTFIRHFILYTFLVIIVFIVWAALIKVDEVAKSQGELTSSLPVHPIQHFYGGTLKSIHVEEGQMVEKGTPLISLDVLEIDSQLQEATVQLEITRGRKKRLENLIVGLESGQTSLSKVKSEHQHQMLEQAFISYASHRKVSEKQIEQLQGQIDEQNLQTQVLKAQLISLKKDLERLEKEGKSSLKLLQQEKEALEEEMEIREDLVDQGLNSNIKFLSLQRNYYQLKKDILENQVENQDKISQVEKQILQIEHQLKVIPLTISQHRSKIMEIQEQLLEGESKFKEKSLKELDEVLEQEGILKEQCLRLQDRVDQSVLKAPIKGFVHQLKRAGPGSIISPGEKVLQLIPFEAKLLASIKVDNRDIGHLRVGQPARIKLTSFDFSRYGSLPGKVLKIAPNSSIDEHGVPYYGAYIEILSLRPSEHRNPLPLKTGMSLDADIITGKKTVMEYLLKPIYASTREAMRER